MVPSDTLDRAHHSYDPAHRDAATAAILHAVVDASMIQESNALVIRTGELTDALVTVLSAAIAMSPSAARSPAAAVEHKRLVIKARRVSKREPSSVRTSVAFLALKESPKPPPVRSPWLSL